MSTAAANIYDTPQAQLAEEVPHVEQKLFSLKGRLSVLGYMARNMVWLLCFALLGGVMFLSMGPMMEGGDSPNMFAMAAMVVAAIAMIPLLFVSLALTAKRLHDLNLSGWWMLLMMIPLLGSLFWIVAMLWPGKNTGNRFGQSMPSGGWEKPVGIIGLVVMVALIVGGMFMDGASIMGFMSV